MAHRGGEGGGRDGGVGREEWVAGELGEGKGGEVSEPSRLSPLSCIDCHCRLCLPLSPPPPPPPPPPTPRLHRVPPSRHSHSSHSLWLAGGSSIVTRLRKNGGRDGDGSGGVYSNGDVRLMVTRMALALALLLLQCPP